MSDEIKTTVYRRKSRKFYEAQWVDPLTGKTKTKTLKGCTTQREAHRAASELEKDLINGVSLGNYSWSDFRLRFRQEHLNKKSDNHCRRVQSSLNVVEDILDPAHISAIRARDIARLRDQLSKPYKKKQGKERPARSASTVAGYLKDLQLALNWAHRQGMIKRVPPIDVDPHVTSGGRAITAEEFERMLAVTPDIVGEAAAESWQHLMRGLWWSGLRLGEAMRLAWEDRGTGFTVDLSLRRPVIHIAAGADKNGQERLLPLAPEFAQMLLDAPESDHRGFVFKPAIQNRADVARPDRDWVGKVIRKIGKKAAVKTKETHTGKTKFAGAHDLRRAFATRWAGRVMPATLMELMRHEDVRTTMKYYYSRNAQTTAETCWAAVEPELSMSTGNGINVHIG
ncbi:site-specific integrase [Planctomycetaceae bacterium]|nr:site-specific integrase [Planctomycetaceae bacterium]